MFPRQVVGLRVPGGDGPQVSSSLGCLAALPEVRVDGQIVTNGILPAVVVALVVRKAIPARRRRERGLREHRDVVRKRFGDAAIAFRPLLGCFLVTTQSTLFSHSQDKLNGTSTIFPRGQLINYKISLFPPTTTPNEAGISAFRTH